MTGVSVTRLANGSNRFGCMLCGSEIDVDGAHRTTGNLGCASSSNPKRRTRRVVKTIVTRTRVVRFELSRRAS